GAVGYAGYDTVRYVERLEHPPADDRKLPDLSFAFYDCMVIFDHISKTIAAVAHAHVPGVRSQESGGRHEELVRRYQDAWARVEALVEQLRCEHAAPKLTDIAPVGQVQRSFQSNFAAGDFEKAVEKAKEYIKAGDIFQVVLSQRIVTQSTAHPFDIY